MSSQRTIWLVALLFLSMAIWAQTDSAKTAKPSIYQGMTIKLDLGSTALELGKSKGKIQHYELAMNWRLKNKWYPTFEAGYAGGTRAQGDSLAYNGQGGFFRVGCDINPLKKHPESPHAMLIGLRLGTAVQAYDQRVVGTTVMPGTSSVMSQQNQIAADCWGEIVGGCQVNLIAGLYMGWMARFRCLFTRKDGITAEEMRPIYIPGYGNRYIIAWNISYHIGYHF